MLKAETVQTEKLAYCEVQITFVHLEFPDFCVGYISRIRQ